MFTNEKGNLNPDLESENWASIVDKNAKNIFRLAYRLTGNKQDAEDITQETFIKVFNNLSKYKEGSFEGWLYRIATNIFLDSVRKSSKYKFDSEDKVNQLSSKELTPVEAYEKKEFDPIVQTALNTLKPEYRLPLVLKDVEGLSYEEISSTLGIRLGTVRSRIHRGRNLIKTQLLNLGYINSSLQTIEEARISEFREKK